MRRTALGWAAFAATAAGGAALGWLGERRALRGVTQGDDPEAAELRRPVRGRPLTVESFDGTALYAEVLGRDDAPTLVFAHGFGLSQHVWHYQRRDLADAYRLVLYDQRGHAGSEEAASGDYSIEAFGRDLAAVVDAAAPAGHPVVLVGHSLGGMTLLAYVDQFPEVVADRVAGAVFLGTSGSDIVTGGVASTGIAAVEILRNSSVQRGFRALDRGARYADRAYAASTDLSFLITRALGLNANASPAHVAFVEQLVLDCPTSIKAAIGPLFTSLDLRAAAPLLTAPALVVVGEKDRLTPPAQAAKLAALLPDAELVELPGVGHTTMLEAHAAVSQLLRRFAARVFAAAG